MKPCPQCGTENLDDANFCHKCGGNIPSVEFQAPPGGDSLSPVVPESAAEIGPGPVTGDTPPSSQPEVSAESPRAEAARPIETVVVQQVSAATSLDELKSAVSGRFEIIREIGRGGMAVVYEAREKSLNRVVAMKVLPKELSYDRQFVERFKREIQTLALLDHPNIIQLYNAEETGGLSYFTMKYVRGKSLTDLIKEEGTIDARQALKIARDVAEGLEYAHSEGVLHRDLKPDNIMMDDRQRVYIMDFGIAKALSQSRVTTAGTAVGTAQYMSPEQCASTGEIDARSDLYSLGVILYEMLTGKLPFDGDTMSVMYQQVNAQPPEVRKLNARVPKGVSALVERLLNKDREKRPSGARALISDIDSLMKEFYGDAAGRKEGKAPNGSSGKGRSFLKVAAILVALGLLGGGGYFAYKKNVIPSLSGVAPKEVKTVGGIEFVYLPGATFEMGAKEGEGDSSERPRHKVSLGAFWMGKFEVTQKQFQDIMGFNPSEVKGDNLPVENVSWRDAKLFADRFAQKHGVIARLPYESEWEYAYRAGSDTRYYWGGEMDGEYAWLKDNSEDKIHPVGMKKPNPFGLHDMSGNVAEWCMDYYDLSYYAKSPADNPMGPALGTEKVLRGGSVDTDPKMASAFTRGSEKSEMGKSKRRGLRLVVLDPKKDPKLAASDAGMGGSARMGGSEGMGGNAGMGGANTIGKSIRATLGQKSGENYPISLSVGNIGMLDSIEVQYSEGFSNKTIKNIGKSTRHTLACFDKESTWYFVARYTDGDTKMSNPITVPACGSGGQNQGW